jgi:signal transduction histidine kinase/HAMP domain-containing protein
MEIQRRRFVSVGTRLAVGTTLLVAVLAALVYAGLTRFQWQTTVAGKAASARMVGTLFREVVATPLVFDDQKGLDEAVHSLMANPEVLGVRVVRVRSGVGLGPVLAESRRDGFTDPLEAPWRTSPEVFERGTSLLLAEHVADTDGEPVAQAVVAFSLQQEKRDYADLSLRILLTALASAAALIFLLMRLARSFIVTPMRRLVRTARGLEAGERITTGVTSNDEVGALAHALDTMAQVVWEREAALATANRDMKRVLDNVSQGLLLVGPSGVMGPQRSAILDRWFGAPPASGLFAAWVEASAPGFAPRFAVSFEQLVEGLMPMEVCLSLLPRALECEGRHLALAYQALTTPGTDALETLLVLISDVTSEVEGQRAAVEQREIVEIFQWLMRDRPGFLSFLAEGTSAVERLARGGQSVVVELREVHTLKGNAGLLGVRSVADLCHQLEGRLVEEGGGLEATERQALARVWEALRQRVSALGGADSSALPVQPEELEDLLTRLGRGAPHRELLELAAGWRNEPALNRLRHLADLARSLSSRLGRGDPEVVLDTDGVRVPPERFASFWAAAVHVVRNAVDHGFEAPATRAEAAKPPRPRLNLGCRRAGARLEVTIADDGAGVPWGRIAAKARVRGLPTETPEHLVDALFADGVSSRDQATELSGRGVGMSAVKQAVEALGGEVFVESVPGRGTTFRFLLPLVARGARLEVA